MIRYIQVVKFLQGHPGSVGLPGPTGLPGPVVSFYCLFDAKMRLQYFFALTGIKRFVRR